MKQSQYGWIALLLVLGVDAFEYRRQGAERTKEEGERKKQHDETASQLEAALKQTKATQDLVEASYRPCIVFATELRDPGMAAIAAGTANGGAMLIYCPGAQAQIHNIGSGPAINIRYTFVPAAPDATLARPTSYLAGIASGDKSHIPVGRGMLQNRDWRVTFNYESVSGHKYGTVISANDLVINDVQFPRVED